MGEYISRQAAINVADSSDYVGLSVEDVKKVTDEVVKGLKRLPSAQPDIARDIATIIENEKDMMAMLSSRPSARQEIIMCKDCKWFNDIGCAIEIVDDSDRPRENDFCSFAERKDNELV